MTEDDLMKERNLLIDKKFRGGLSKEEEIRLEYIRDELDKIDMERLGGPLKELEEYVEKRVKLARDIQKLLKEFGVK